MEVLKGLQWTCAVVTLGFKKIKKSDYKAHGDAFSTMDLLWNAETYDTQDLNNKVQSSIHIHNVTRNIYKCCLIHEKESVWKRKVQLIYKMSFFWPNAQYFLINSQLSSHLSKDMQNYIHWIRSSLWIRVSLIIQDKKKYNYNYQQLTKSTWLMKLHDLGQKTNKKHKTNAADNVLSMIIVVYRFRKQLMQSFFLVLWVSCFCLRAAQKEKAVCPSFFFLYSLNPNI